MNSRTTRPSSRRSAALVVATVAAVRCTVGPDFHEPTAELPDHFAATPAGDVDRSALARWWTTLHDPELDTLVERALAANLDVRQATERVREARALRAAAIGGLYPRLDAVGSYQRSSSLPATHELFQAGFDASWELDVFGGTRRGVEAASADLLAAVEERRDRLVTVAAETAVAYLDLVGLRREIAVARADVEAQQRVADVTRRRQRGGFVSTLDVANAEALVATTESSIAPLEAEATRTLHALSVLLGREPAALESELATSGALPVVPATVPPGLPSELLERRPDVRRAAAQLHAATARVGVATADLYPKFSLTGALELASDQLSTLLRWSRRSWSVGGVVNWDVFDGGRLRALVEASDAQTAQALLAWQSSVLVALEDVDDSLVNLAREREHHASLESAVAANRRAVDVAQRLYREGQTGFLSVLAAQRSLFTNDLALAQSERTLATDLVAFYKALGGGWDVDAARE